MCQTIFSKVKTSPSKGYILQKVEDGLHFNEATEEASKVHVSNVEFHPVLFNQHKKSPYKELPSFNEAVDEFFSNLESQKIESKIHQKVCEVEYCS